MKKSKIFSNIILFGLIILIFGCAERWQRYSSDAGFSIEMPGEPEGKKIIIDTELGQNYLYVYMLKKQDGMIYSIGFIDYPNELFNKKSTEQLLNDAREGAVRNVGGKLVSESQISIKGYPGREVVIASSGGQGSLQARIFLVNNRLYQLMFAPAKGNTLSRNARRFFESFEIE